MTFRNPKFEQLQKEWYEKLKDSGFNDIEQADGNLKQWASSAFKHNVDKLSDAREMYYRLAGHFLYDHKFSSERDRGIWELHSEGKSRRDIEAILGYNHNTVGDRIRRLRKKMLKNVK